MATQHNNPIAPNGQPSQAEAFERAFVSPDFDNRIIFLTRRICAAGRMSIGAGPVQRLFWQAQIASFHQALKAAMVNPFFKAGER